MTYNTQELGGSDARRLTTLCLPVAPSNSAIGGSCNLTPTTVDTARCTTQHCDLPPWNAQATSTAQCAPLCAGSGDCGATQVCGLVYNGLAENPVLPSTGEGAGRYYEAVLGCYTPYFRLNAFVWEYRGPGVGGLGASCDASRVEGRLDCRSHLCGQFPSIWGQCTDFCDEDSDCVSPQTPNWRCRYADMNFSSIFLQSYDIADVTRFTLLRICAP